MSQQEFYETVQREQEYLEDTKMKNIATALVKAQKDFAPALKSNNNPFFKSKYADLSVCIESVIDSLHNNGIALIQKNHDCENGIKVETILLHESGEQFSGGILHVPAIKNDPQAYGSALTYARRYSLMATCGIAPEDDDGNAASKPKESTAPKQVETPKPVSLITMDQVAEIQALANDAGVELSAICAACKVDSLNKIPSTMFASVIKKLNAKFIKE